MGIILRLICFWGIADGIFLSVLPKRWAKTWGDVVEIIGKERVLSLLGGGFEMAICLWILQRLGIRKSKTSSK